MLMYLFNSKLLHCLLSYPLVNNPIPNSSQRVCHTNFDRFLLHVLALHVLSMQAQYVRGIAFVAYHVDRFDLCCDTW